MKPEHEPIYVTALVTEPERERPALVRVDPETIRVDMVCPVCGHPHSVAIRDVYE